MASSQDLSPLNPQLMDTLVSADSGWLPTGEDASTRAGISRASLIMQA